jgi:hypothetical protein
MNMNDIIATVSLRQTRTNLFLTFVVNNKILDTISSGSIGLRKKRRRDKVAAYIFGKKFFRLFFDYLEIYKVTKIEFYVKCNMNLFNSFYRKFILNSRKLVKEYSRSMYRMKRIIFISTYDDWVLYNAVDDLYRKEKEKVNKLREKYMSSIFVSKDDRLAISFQDNLINYRIRNVMMDVCNVYRWLNKERISSFTNEKHTWSLYNTYEQHVNIEDNLLMSNYANHINMYVKMFSGHKTKSSFNELLPKKLNVTWLVRQECELNSVQHGQTVLYLNNVDVLNMMNEVCIGLKDSLYIIDDYFLNIHSMYYGARGVVSTRDVNVLIKHIANFMSVFPYHVSTKYMSPWVQKIINSYILLCGTKNKHAHFELKYGFNSSIVSIFNDIINNSYVRISNIGNKKEFISYNNENVLYEDQNITNNLAHITVSYNEIIIHYFMDIVKRLRNIDVFDHTSRYELRYITVEDDFRRNNIDVYHSDCAIVMAYNRLVYCVCKSLKLGPFFYEKIINQVRKNKIVGYDAWVSYDNMYDILCLKKLVRYIRVLAINICLSRINKHMQNSAAILKHNALALIGYRTQQMSVVGVPIMYNERAIHVQLRRIALFLMKKTKALLKKRTAMFVKKIKKLSPIDAIIFFDVYFKHNKTEVLKKLKEIALLKYYLRVLRMRDDESYRHFTSYFNNAIICKYKLGNLFYIPEFRRKEFNKLLEHVNRYGELLSTLRNSSVFDTPVLPFNGNKLRKNKKMI